MSERRVTRRRNLALAGAPGGFEGGIVTGKLRSAGQFGAATSIVKLAAALVAVVLVAANLAFIAATATIAPVAADTMPAEPSPETVSAAALPTVQIDGVVWDQVIAGNRVFVTGQFTSARPAGAAAGVNETPRSNILAYDLTTGEPDHVLGTDPQRAGHGDQGVGGRFDRSMSVATSIRSTDSGVAASPRSTRRAARCSRGTRVRTRGVDAIAVTNSVIYFGGGFTSVGTTTTGFQARTRLAAADAATGAILPWNPSADKIVFSMVYHPGTGQSHRRRHVQHAQRSERSPAWARSTASAVALRPWAANTVIINHDGNAAIGSLTTDGEKIFGIGWAYFGGGGVANFEGAFSADPATGVLDWVDGGRGDNYDLSVTGDVVYVVGHPHDWGMLDFNPQYDPYKFQRAVAIDKHRSPTLTNAYGTSDIWVFDGMPAAQPLHWLPTLTGGYLHRSGAGCVERRQQRGLHRPRRRVPARQRCQPVRPRALREEGDLAVGRRHPELLRARDDGHAVGARDRARRLDGGVGPRQRAVEGRGPARSDDRDVDRLEDLPDRDHVVEPAAARLRRRDRAAGLEPDLPAPHDGPDRQHARRTADHRDDPGRDHARAVHLH